MADVPCNGCTACCRGSDTFPRALYLTENDALACIERGLYCFMTTVPERPGLVWALGVDYARNCCLYLDDEKGCTVYDKRPQACRHFDCRTFADEDLPEHVAIAARECRAR